MRKKTAFLSFTLAITLSVGLFLIPSLIYAQTTGDIPEFKPLTNVDGTPFKEIFSTNATLGDFFQGLFNLSITIGALLAVLMLAWSGWQYMTSDVVSMKGDAKKRIQNALIGLLMLLATVLVLRQINPDLVSLSILNTGGGVAATQNNDTPSAGGRFVDTPRGYCTPESSGYRCYNNLLSCGQNHGLNSCTPYSTAYNDAYGPDSGRDTPLPDGNSTYKERRWINNIGRDVNNNLLRCVDALGAGWVDQPASMCGAVSGINPNGQCCALPAEYASTTPLTGELYSSNEQQYISAGRFCYLTNNTYSCFANIDACAAAKTASSTCLVRSATNTWATPPTGITTYRTTQPGQICGNAGDGTEFGYEVPDQRYSCGYVSVAACTAAQNGTLTECKQY